MATFVLVHGTTAGGWVWKTIATELEAAGHTVYRPSLTGLGERTHLLTRDVGALTHITDIVNLFEFEDLDEVVLVGHSYGGLVITGVADQLPDRIRELIYFDAVVPEDGESAMSGTDPETLAADKKRVDAEGDGWLVPVDAGPIEQRSKNRPHPYKSWIEPIRLTNPAREAVPATYVRFTRDKEPGSLWWKRMERNWARAQAKGWRLREVDTVHQIMPDPMPKAQVLLELYPAGT
jgi:pimeloyl-ACP methyl ester carboxylesterase